MVGLVAAVPEETPAFRSTLPSLPKSMSDAFTVATVKDIPNNALATRLPNQPPIIPAPDSTPAVPQNAVPSQPSFVGSIIGDKYVLYP